MAGSKKADYSNLKPVGECLAMITAWSAVAFVVLEIINELAMMS